MNKWLKPRVPDGYVIHSLRYSLRDGKCTIGCPGDTIGAIGGWTKHGFGHQYVKGHTLINKNMLIEKYSV